MPDIDQLSIKIEAESTKAAEKVNDLASALERLGKSVKGSGFSSVSEKIKSIGAATKASPTVAINADTTEVDEATQKVDILQRAKDKLGIGKTKVGVDSSDVDKANKKVGMLSKALSAIKRIAFYRAIRAGMKIVSEAFSTGTKNLYQYSKALGTEFSYKMDMLATSALYLKNSLGAMASPLINAIAPVVDMLVDKFVDLLNIINQVFAALSGKTTYTRAIKQTQEYADATNKAAKAVRSFQLGIDELNVIEPDTGGAGGAGQDFSNMFEEAEISDNILDITNKLKPLIPIVGAIGAGFAAWKISSSLAKGIENIRKKLRGLGGNKNISVGFSTIGLVGFLNDMQKFSSFFEDFKKNGPTFKNVVGMLSEFVGGIGDIAIIAGNLKLGGFLKLIQGIGEIVVAIKDISENGVNWNNANLVIQGITDIGVAVSAMTGNWKLGGVFLAVQGLSTIITEIGKNWDAIQKGDWSGVDKGTLFIGVVEVIGGIAVALGTIEKAKGLFSAGGASSSVTSVANEVGAVNSPLKELAKNLAWGIVIIVEVSASAIIFVGAIQIMGRQLEDIGKAWQPVIDNGPTIAEAVVIGTGILAAIGLASAGLGAATKGSGGTIALDIAVGAGVLLGVGAEAILFLAEIETVGEKLNDIKTAWEPINDHGEEIANDILIGTGLLAGIGAASAGLGAITMATGGTLAGAIAIGAGVLAEMGLAAVAFTESLVAVSDELSENLAPALRRLNPKLPQLKDDMSDFADLMTDLSDEISSYTSSMGTITWDSIVRGFQKLFAGNPIQDLADDVDTISGDAKDLNEKLRIANPEVRTAVSLTSEYVSLMSQLENKMGEKDSVTLPDSMYTNLKVVGEKLVTGLVDGIDNKKSNFNKKMEELKNTITTNMDTAAKNAKTSIQDIINKLNEIPKNIKTTVSVTQSSLGTYSSTPKRFATGGFPDQGQMFIAREAGPELVGNIGGKTAVANNSQIESGIEEAAYRGFMRAMSESGGNQSQQPIVVESKLYLDGKQVTASVEKTQRERGAAIMSGGVMR